MDMDRDEMARALVPPPPRRAHDILEDLRRANDAAFILCDIDGRLDHGLAQVAAENMRRLCVELAGGK
jgi:hypothetical protein